MAIRYEVEKHTVCNIGNLLAQNYGEHMFSFKLEKDTDNGRVVKVGDWNSLDQYSVAEATAIDAEIVEKMANGNFMVLVRDPKDCVLIYQKPLIAEESPRKLTLLSNFFNEAGDVVRGYGLHKFDRFELSAEGFEGTPVKGAKITTIQDGKLVVA